MSAARIKELEAEIAALKQADKPPRTLSIMARNVQHGDHVNFPNLGWKEVNGWGHDAKSDDTVLSAMGSHGIVHTFPGHKRVQVRRYG